MTKFIGERKVARIIDIEPGYKRVFFEGEESSEVFSDKTIEKVQTDEPATHFDLYTLRTKHAVADILKILYLYAIPLEQVGSVLQDAARTLNVRAEELLTAITGEERIDRNIYTLHKALLNKERLKLI